MNYAVNETKNVQEDEARRKCPKRVTGSLAALSRYSPASSAPKQPTLVLTTLPLKRGAVQDYLQNASLLYLATASLTYRRAYRL